MHNVHNHLRGYDKPAHPENIFTQTLFGIPTMQTWADLWLWEQLFQTYEVATVVEIGAMYGGLSLYLQSQAKARGIVYRGLDINPPTATKNPLGKALRLSACMTVGDVFDGAGAEKMAALLSDTAKRPLLLFCDGGNKPHEMQTFAPQLRTGDIVGVHDWGNEIDETHVAALLVMLEPLALPDLGPESLTRFWRRV